MSKQSFSEKNLKITFDSRKKQSKSISEKITNKTFQEIEDDINNMSYTMVGISSFKKGNNSIYQMKTIEDDVVISKLNYNIRSIYKVKQKDRHTIVNQILSILKEHSPKYIYRLDIKKFYESVDLDVISKRVINDNVLSSQSEYILQQYITLIKKNLINGMPRGINLSATLSDLYMKKFDKEMSMNENVIYFTRFVDDIIFISTKRINLKNEVINKLPEGLSLNWKKTKITKIMDCYCSEKCNCKKQCKCKDKCQCAKVNKIRKFDYLGYEFSFPETINNRFSSSINVGLSNSKFKKIRNRIYLCFKDYENNGNIELLKNRVKFLSGNHYIENNKNRTDIVKSGVFYNYIHINELERYEELDKILRKFIFSWSSTRHKLTIQHKKYLNKHSFVFGFKNKYTTKFTGSQINKIKSCWNNG